MKSLTIDRCPHGEFAISVVDDEKQHGVRLTPTKCCGIWESVKEWPIMDDEAITSFANSILDEVELIRYLNEKGSK